MYKFSRLAVIDSGFFVNAVRTGDRSAIRSPYSDAVRSLAVSLAMNQSARENRPVKIAELG